MFLSLDRRLFLKSPVGLVGDVGWRRFELDEELVKDATFLATLVVDERSDVEDPDV